MSLLFDVTDWLLIEDAELGKIITFSAYCDWDEADLLRSKLLRKEFFAEMITLYGTKEHPHNAKWKVRGDLITPEEEIALTDETTVDFVMPATQAVLQMLFDLEADIRLADTNNYVDQEFIDKFVEDINEGDIKDDDDDDDDSDDEETEDADDQEKTIA